MFYRGVAHLNLNSTKCDSIGHIAYCIIMLLEIHCDGVLGRIMYSAKMFWLCLMFCICLLLLEPCSAEKVRKRCKSKEGATKICSIDGNKKVLDIISVDKKNKKCGDGENYGISDDNESIWVTNGCTARFTLKVCHGIYTIIKFIWAASWQNQQCGCAPSKDSDQPGHPPSLIRVFAVRLMFS